MNLNSNSINSDQRWELLWVLNTSQGLFKLECENEFLLPISHDTWPCSYKEYSHRVPRTYSLQLKWDPRNQCLEVSLLGDYGNDWRVIQHYANCFMDSIYLIRIGVGGGGHCQVLLFRKGLSLCPLQLPEDRSDWGYRPSHVCSLADSSCVEGASSTNLMIFLWEPVESTKDPGSRHWEQCQQHPLSMLSDQGWNLPSFMLTIHVSHYSFQFSLL